MVMPAQGIPSTNQISRWGGYATPNYTIASPIGAAMPRQGTHYQGKKDSPTPNTIKEATKYKKCYSTQHADGFNTSSLLLIIHDNSRR